MSMNQKAGPSSKIKIIDHAKSIFKDTAIEFTCEGKRHLGAVMT